MPANNEMKLKLNGSAAELVSRRNSTCWAEVVGARARFVGGSRSGKPRFTRKIAFLDRS